MSVLACPPPQQPVPSFMDNKSSLQHQPIENAADYVDSLLRPPPENQAVKWKFIAGRRMRDKFLPSVIVPDELPTKGREKR